MVEGRRLPAGLVVARGAFLRCRTLRELTGMDVFVAAGARCRGAAKYDLLRGFQASRMMALGARDRAVRAVERKLRGRMVEGSQFFPGLDRVACVAVLFRRCWELSLMRILVASEARQYCELILGRRLGVLASRRLMAARAGSGGMSPSQVEARVLMPRQSECGRPEAICGVTRFAAVEVGGGGKLFPVRILMAVRTRFVLHAVERVPSSGQMAFGAEYRRVLAEQRVGRVLVPRRGIERGLETVLPVAAGAILFWKLPFVRIGRVAVRAQRVGHGFFEVAVLMAPVAVHFGVRAVKWEMRAAVVEGG